MCPFAASNSASGSGEVLRADSVRQPEADEGDPVLATREHTGVSGDDPPAREDGDTIGEVLRLVHVVRREQDRRAERAQVRDELPGAPAG